MNMLNNLKHKNGEMKIVKGQPNINFSEENTVANIKSSLNKFNSRLETAVKKKLENIAVEQKLFILKHKEK